LLAPNLALALVVSPLSRALLAVGRPEVKLQIDVLSLVVPPSVLWLLSPRGVYVAFAGFGLATTTVYAVYLWLIFRTVRRRMSALNP
jgi:hypothetical protein